MGKTVTLRIEDKTYQAFVRKAKAENRSLANFIETAVKAHIQETAFADDAEMAEILATEQLLDRLRKGSHDARRKKGTLIG